MNVKPTRAAKIAIINVLWHHKHHKVTYFRTELLSEKL